MSSTTTSTSTQQLALFFQYTIEAYKTFEKLAENLPNPMSAGMFKGFATDERHHRDLLSIKYGTIGSPIPITLGADLRFQDIIEGELSYREIAEWLISRERTIDSKLLEAAKDASGARNLYIYMAAGKRAHVALLERELQLIQIYPDWFKREDAEDLIIHGTR
jgi:hypothetical protein